MAAPYPWADPSEYLKLDEMLWAWIDGLIKKGEVEEFGYFADGISGYVIGKGETIDVHRNILVALPWTTCEVHEIIPWEKGKEIRRAVDKAKIAAAKK